MGIIATCSYYDLPEKVRMNLSEEDFQAYAIYECMKEGVQVPLPARILPLPAEPEIKKQTIFQIVADNYYEIISFRDKEEAVKFLEFSSVVKVDHDYSIGSGYKYVKSYESLAVRQTEVYSLDSFTQLKEQLTAYKSIKTRNEEEQKRFDKEASQYLKVVDGMNEDRQQLWGDKRDFERILTMWKQYLQMANNDAFVATNFLKKVYSQEKIQEAYAWLDASTEWDASAPEFEPPVQQA
jgi:hypothetical protein